MICIDAYVAQEALSEKAAYLDAFFKVVAKLVPKVEFPHFFKGLHIEGEVKKEDVAELLEEVKQIETILKEKKIDKNLLNDPDFKKTPDLHERYLNKNAKNVAEWFQTQQRLNIFEVLLHNIDYARRKEAPVYIKYYLM